MIERNLSDLFGMFAFCNDAVGEGGEICYKTSYF